VQKDKTKTINADNKGKR